jgi:hypothetical protein
MVHAKTGDARLTEELGAAVEASREDIGLSTGAKIGLAKSCLDNDNEDAASEIILDVMKMRRVTSGHEQGDGRV